MTLPSVILRKHIKCLQAFRNINTAAERLVVADYLLMLAGDKASMEHNVAYRSIVNDARFALGKPSEISQDKDVEEMKRSDLEEDLEDME